MHPFFEPLDVPLNRSVSGDNSRRQWGYILEMVSTKTDGYVMMWHSEFNSRASQATPVDGIQSVYESLHRRDYIGTFFSGVGEYAGDTFMIGCGYAELGELGPTEDTRTNVRGHEAVLVGTEHW